MYGIGGSYPNAAWFDGQSDLTSTTTAIAVDELLSLALRTASHVGWREREGGEAHQNSVDV